MAHINEGSSVSVSCGGHSARVDGGTALTMEEVIARYGRLVAAAARRVIGPRGDLDDVVQETWVTYLRSGHQVSDSRCLGGWLFQVATRLAIRAQRAASRCDLVDDMSLTRDCDDTPTPELDVLRAQRRQAVNAVSHGLRASEQALLTLLLDDADLGYRQISERSGLPIGSVGPMRERMIRKLRATPAIQRLADEPVEGGTRAIGCAA